MADNPEGQSCGNCIYFKLQQNGATSDAGHCRLQPPRIVVGYGGMRSSLFPEVRAGEWCGVWKAPPA